MTKKYQELRQAYKQLLEDNQKLMADNRDLRNQLEGAKVLIYQQKNLVRCRDCVNHNPTTKECFRHGWRYPMNPEDFCSKGVRKDDQV